MNAWIYLSLAIVIEVIGTSFLKLSNGFSHSVYTSLCLVCFAAALYLLSLSIKQIDISVVYAIWSGVGIALITFIGVFVFNESMTFTRLFFIGLIAIGVIGLQITSQACVEHSTSSEL
jgi:Membrane transporters of cations and cationic drugs